MISLSPGIIFPLPPCEVKSERHQLSQVEVLQEESKASLFFARGLGGGGKDVANLADRGRRRTDSFSEFFFILDFLVYKVYT